MKKLQKFISILAVFSCLFSCNKGDDNKQASPLADTVLTKERLIGKWDVKSVAQYFYVNDSVTYSYTFDRWGEKRIDGDLMGYWQSYDYSFLTFNEEDSFYQSTLYGNGASSMLNVFLPDSGKWRLNNDTLMMPNPVDPNYTNKWMVMKYTRDGLYIRNLETYDDSAGSKYDYDEHIVMTRSE